MVAFAPFCNVTILAPAADPRSPNGFRQIPPNATLADVINTVNNNFAQSTQDNEFNRQMQNDLKKSDNQSQIKDAIKKETGQLRFTQMSIVRQKIKVENPQDKEQWVIDDRVKALVMKDQRTGALWTWQDKSAGRGVQAGTEETEMGEG